jgi:hypothetical protein
MAVFRVTAADADMLDLSHPASGSGRHIRPCKACDLTAA